MKAERTAHLRRINFTACKLYIFIHLTFKINVGTPESSIKNKGWSATSYFIQKQIPDGSKIHTLKKKAIKEKYWKKI